MALTIVQQSAPTSTATIGAWQVVTSLTSSGTTATATLATHGYSTGDTVVVINSSTSGYNLTATITVVDSNTFTYTVASGLATPAATASTIFARKNNDSGLGTINIQSQTSQSSIISYGAFNARPGGPKNSGDVTANGLGWSYDLHSLLIGNQSTYHTTQTITGSLLTLGCFSAWYYIKSITVNGQNGNRIASIYSNAGGNQYIDIFADTSGVFAYELFNSGSYVRTAVTVPMNQWFEFRMAWQRTSTAHYNLVIQYRLAHTSSWVTIYSNSNITAYNSWELLAVKAGNVSAGNMAFIGRYGMPTLMTMGTFADNTLSVPNQIDPPAAPITWYLDPANASGTASDSNDGVTAATPWLTAGKANIEATYAGFFSVSIATAWQTAVNGVATGTPADLTQSAAALMELYQQNTLKLTGDTLIINNNGLKEIPINTTLSLTNVIGITLASSGGVTAPASMTYFKSILPSAWTLVSGKTYTYSCTDTGTQVVLWQNREAMRHPTGANYAAVATSLESTAGSFWTDGTTMYLHPFGNTNPGTDGNCYERSQATSSQTGGVAVGVHSLIQGINFSGTTLVDPSSGQPVQGYGFSMLGNGDKLLNIFDTLESDYYDKHAFGIISNTLTNSRDIWINCKGQRGNPWASYGGQWTFVDYTTAGSGNQAYYKNCSSGNGNAQLIGSRLAVCMDIYQVYGTHGSGNGWSSVDFLNCDFSLAGGFYIESSATVTATNCLLNDLSAKVTHNQCYIYCGASYNHVLQGTYYNCIIIINNPTLGGSLAEYGPFHAHHCTIDYSKAGFSPWLAYQNALTLEFDSCVLIPGSYQLAATGAGSGVTFTNCEIQGSASFNILTTATLAQLTTSGQATNSVMVSKIAVDSTNKYQRTAQSTVTTNDGALSDYTGVLWANRRTAGAYEYAAATGAKSGTSGPAGAQVMGLGF